MAADAKFREGIIEGIKDQVAGLWGMVTNPVRTAVNLYNAVSHPIETGKAIANAAKETSAAIANGDTKTAGKAASGIITASMAATLGKVGNAAKAIDKVEDVAKAKGLVTGGSSKLAENAGAKGGTIGERLFLSEKFGITSEKFGSSAVNAQGTLNKGGGLFKAGWSTGTNSAGQWGYKFRIGVGSSSTNSNIARFHIYVPKSFVSNNFANSSIQVKRSLFNLGLKP